VTDARRARRLPVFEDRRSEFGKSGAVHFFWGSFDLAVTRFSGRSASERAGADAITCEACSDEVAMPTSRLNLTTFGTRRCSNSSFPAPHLSVYWSEQSWDEMYQAFTEYSVDSQLVIAVPRQTSQQQ